MKRSFLIVVLGCMLNLGFCQSKVNIAYSYSVIRLDSTFDAHPDAKMKKYIDQLDTKMNQEIGVVIGKSVADLSLETPVSPMSNFVVDMLFQVGDSLSKAKDGIPVDLSLLNFGGIRKTLSSGDIKISDIYEVFPFDNLIVFLTIKGSELKKMVQKFNLPTSAQPLGNAEITFKNGKLATFSINKKEIIDDHLYRLATIDFIQTGGDKIMDGIQIESAFNTYILLREALIGYVKSMTAQHKSIQAVTDQRIIYY